MKVAVSIPDETFDRAESLAKRLKLSRSRIYAKALDAFVAEHQESDLTAAINRVVDEIGDQTDPFVTAAVRRTLRSVEW